MKKKLEAELISIAHRILQLKDSTTLPQLQEEARNLYEKLAILNFAESHFSGPQPTIGQIRSIIEEEITTSVKKETLEIVPSKESISETTNTLEEKIIEEEKPSIETSNIKPAPIINLEPEPIPEATPEDLHTLGEEILEEEKPSIETLDTKPEIIIEKINEKVTGDLFVPITKVTEENISISEPVYEKNDMEDIGTATSMPVLDTINDQDDKPKSLNDQLKKGINIGLNDRLAFIKHLFDGSSTDYNRVLSQLNTLNSKSGASQFIKNMVKPDYNNWQGKEEYEDRFMEIVTSKYEF